MADHGGTISCECDGEGPNGQKSYGYDCVDKCDKAEFLSQGCEPGPTVSHAVNDKGTHGPKGYCLENCHSTDAFVQTRWISDAKRSNGKPIVPMMGFDPDYEISWLESPYHVVNMDAQGWSIPKQLVSDEAGPCISCHRAGGPGWIRQFANWTTGNVEGGGPISNGDSYWNKITDPYKAFAKSHWMPMRLDGINAETWEASKWGKAVAHLNKCNANSTDPECILADVPRGDRNPPAPGRRVRPLMGTARRAVMLTACIVVA